MEVTKGMDLLVINGEKITNRRSVIGPIGQGLCVFGPVRRLGQTYETQTRFFVHFEKKLGNLTSWSLTNLN